MLFTFSKCKGRDADARMRAQFHKNSRFRKCSNRFNLRSKTASLTSAITDEQLYSATVSTRLLP
jgi:hypothetical protein